MAHHCPPALVVANSMTTVYDDASGVVDFPLRAYSCIRGGPPRALNPRRPRRRPRRAPFLAEPVRYVVFDLLYYRGRCLTDRPFEKRLHLLHTRLPELACVSLCEGVIGEGRAFFQAAIDAGHEGVVAKALASRYPPDVAKTAEQRVTGACSGLLPQTVKWLARLGVPQPEALHGILRDLKGGCHHRSLSLHKGPCSQAATAYLKRVAQIHHVHKSR
jgi:hypothetical protein